MWERIGAMVFKEVRQMARDPSTIAMMFFFPIILAKRWKSPPQ